MYILIGMVTLHPVQRQKQYLGVPKACGLNLRPVQMKQAGSLAELHLLLQSCGCNGS